MTTKQFDRPSTCNHKVLVLGSGYVSAPCVHFLSHDQMCDVTVVSQFRDQLDELCGIVPRMTPVCLQLTSGCLELDNLVMSHDLVVSLLPYALHPDVARLCIKHEKNMVTASYINEAMRSLHDMAVSRGITILNEVGLDPGIDHMLAMEVFNKIKEKGGTVTSYISYCGGLPSPQDAECPLRYKFSWFPKGVLLNCLAGARYLKDNHLVDISADGGLLDATEDLQFLPEFDIQGFPNRDSTTYIQQYGLENAHTILRGTIRYKGFTKGIQGLMCLGLLETGNDDALDPASKISTWADYLCHKVGVPCGTSHDQLVSAVTDQLENDADKIKCVVDLGLTGDIPIEKFPTPLDTLSNYLSKRLAYGADEKDLVLMHHEIGVSWEDGRIERRDVDLIQYGDTGGFSAMAKTVGLPVGIAARMLLNGQISKKGVCGPLEKQVYLPVLEQLKREGIVAVETVTEL